MCKYNETNSMRFQLVNSMYRNHFWQLYDMQPPKETDDRVDRVNFMPAHPEIQR